MGRSTCKDSREGKPQQLRVGGFDALWQQEDEPCFTFSPSSQITIVQLIQVVSRRLATRHNSIFWNEHPMIIFHLSFLRVPDAGCFSPKELDSVENLNPHTEASCKLRGGGGVQDCSMEKSVTAEFSILRFCKIMIIVLDHLC